MKRLIRYFLLLLMLLTAVSCEPPSESPNSLRPPKPAEPELQVLDIDIRDYPGSVHMKVASVRNPLDDPYMTYKWQSSGPGEVRPAPGADGGIYEQNCIIHMNEMEFGEPYLLQVSGWYKGNLVAVGYRYIERERRILLKENFLDETRCEVKALTDVSGNTVKAPAFEWTVRDSGGEPIGFTETFGSTIDFVCPSDGIADVKCSATIEGRNYEEEMRVERPAEFITGRDVFISYQGYVSNITSYKTTSYSPLFTYSHIGYTDEDYAGYQYVWTDENGQGTQERVGKRSVLLGQSLDSMPCTKTYRCTLYGAEDRGLTTPLRTVTKTVNYIEHLEMHMDRTDRYDVYYVSTPYMLAGYGYVIEYDGVRRDDILPVAEGELRWMVDLVKLAEESSDPAAKHRLRITANECDEKGKIINSTKMNSAEISYWLRDGQVKFAK